MERDLSGTERRTVDYWWRTVLCGVACCNLGVYGYLLSRRVTFYRKGDSPSLQESSIGGDRERRTERTEIRPGPFNGFFYAARPTFGNFCTNGDSRRYR